MSFQEIVDILVEKANQEGLIENDTSNLLFSSFGDINIWSPISLDYTMSNSSFHIAKLNSQLTPINIKAGSQEDDAYLIVRYTKDDISKYLNYLKFEFQSYAAMQDLKNGIIVPIGYTQRQEGFLFAFITSTNLTLNDAIGDIKKLTYEEKFADILKIMDNVNQSLKQDICGFHITPKTILIDRKYGSVGLIGFIGEIKDLQLCETAAQFSYNMQFSAPELKKKRTLTVRAPNSASDVFGLAKITQFIIGDELKIASYQKMITSALQDNQNDRLSLNDFIRQMHEVQKEDFTVEQKNLLVDIIVKMSKPVKKLEKSSMIYKLPINIIKNDTVNKLKKAIVGPEQTEKREEIKILVVGKTGSGKTTFINGIVNYLYGVNWKDDCRFIIVSDDDEGQRNGRKNQAESQTDDVTSYTLYWQPNFAIPYTVTLVDTPGFGDTRGMKQDKIIVDRIHSFFQNSNGCGIDSLNAIVFVAKSTDNRLDTFQKYIFNEVGKLFANDIAQNINIVLTFDDGNPTEILKSFTEIKIPINYVNRFNNAALFADPNGGNALINNGLWISAMENYKKFFTNVYNLKAISLYLTQDVLRQRKSLDNTVEIISKKIHFGLSQLNELQTNIELLNKYKKQIEQGKNFKKRVPRQVLKDIPLKKGEFVTNCRICHTSCHYPCFISDDSKKYNCCAINSQGFCKECGCKWQHHHNDPFHWDYVTEWEEVTTQHLKDMYDEGNNEKPKVENMVNKAVEQYISVWDECTRLVGQCKNCINRLHQIALQPVILTEKEYIDIQIQDEKKLCRHDWQSRVEWYENLKKQQDNLQKISNGENIMIVPHDQAIKEFLEKRLGRKLNT